MDVKTILWPTDLSRNSIKALDQASSLSEKYQAKIVVLYVGIDLKSYQPFWGNFPSPEVYDRFETWELGEAKQRLEKLCAEKLSNCPAYEIHVTVGDPATEIVKLAEQAKADMIVMSSHGMTQCRLEESGPEPTEVAMKVSRTSPVPVHLVNPC